MTAILAVDTATGHVYAHPFNTLNPICQSAAIGMNEDEILIITKGN